jgi:aspartyl-tRNA(Asn)/glutamyl-tRNA(Gln) amidotransferase subunit A
VTFDCAGPVARSVADACITLEAIAGKYPKGEMHPDYRNLRKNRPRRFRLGWPQDFFFERLDGEVRRLVETAGKLFESSLGARIRKSSLPRLAGAIDVATNVVVGEASYYHETQGYYPALAEGYGDDVRSHLQWGHDLRAVDYLRGVAKRREIEGDFAAAFEHADVILAPTSPIPAPPIGTSEVRVAGERETAVRTELLRLTRPANLTGLPAISIPCGFTREGLPVGLQLIAPKWAEARLLSIALAYEEATDWHNRHPNLD